MKKKISIVIPTFNEEENVLPMSEAIVSIMKKELPKYAYELIFIDNCSTDNTQQKLREICADNKNVKAIFNARNFGQNNSPIHGLCQSTGDCTIGMACDFQDPVDMIPKYVKEWENGYKIVVGIKKSSTENKIMYGLRSCYYKLLHKLSEVEIIEHFTGAGLYDKTFIEVLKNLNDSTPFLRGIVAELGYKIKTIPYEQPKRRAGKTHNNFFSLYDIAMLSITSYTKTGLRFATFLGMLCAVCSFFMGLLYFFLKIFNWNNFQAGIAPLMIGVFLIGSVQLLFIGILGEYVMNINQRVMHRPLVIEEERINFDTIREEETNE